MKKDKMNGLQWTVLVLAGIVIVLSGYLVYDKIFKTDEIDEVNKMLDLDKLSDYVNYDGSYASMEQLLFRDANGKIRIINLGMDGKVYSGAYSSRIDITNVSDVIDIIGLQSSIIENSKCYMLTNDGDVYVYNLSWMLDGKYEAKKIEDIHKVDRLIEFNYSTSINASSVWGIIAVLNNNEYVKLDEIDE